jgi:CHAT domain-containing protein
MLLVSGPSPAGSRAAMHAWFPRICSACGVLLMLAALGVKPASAQTGMGGFTRTVPTAAYFGSLEVYYDGDYRDALGQFLGEAQGGMKNAVSSWIDSICYHTMAGECYYQLGQPAQALERYSHALQLFVNFNNWMIRVNFSPSIQAGGAGSVKAVPWGGSKRNFQVGSFPDTTLISQGQVNNNAVIQRGGIVQPAVLFPVNVQEIVRCTALAMRRRRELMGPAGPHDLLTNELIAVLSRRPGQPNHWSECWIDLQLGMAFAAGGKDAQAKTSLERALVAGGQFDHPMTSMALLELGRLALTGGDFVTASRYFEEATYAAVNFYDPGVLEEAFRLGFMTHMISNQKGMYPPLTLAAEWARRNDSRQLMTSLLIMTAENACAFGETKTALNWINDARVAIGRGDMSIAKLGARLNYVNALALFQGGSVDLGETALASAIQFQRHGSTWLFHILLTDQSLSNTVNPMSPRVAMDLYTALLRDPGGADWMVDPLEALSILMVPHPISFENWFEVALARKEYERALEISDLARRHRFLSSQAFGGRLTSLRWLLESPVEQLDAKARLERQELLVRYPGYDQLSQQAHKMRAELLAQPVVREEPADAKAQANKLTELSNLSAAQETILREIALRREPCSMIFPPVRTTKEVQQSLPPGHALLAFFCTSSKTHGFLMTNDKYGYWPITSPKAVERQVISLLRKLGNYEQNKELRLAELQDGGWKKPAHEVLQLLTADSKANLPYNFQELIIVPDNLIWYVPFEALQVDDGPNQEQVSLISKVRIRYAPTVGLGVPDTRPRLARGNLAVVLGRLFPNDSEDVSQAAFDELEQAVPGALCVKGHLFIPSGLYKTLFDRLVVLGDIAPAESPYSWSPIPLDHRSPGSTLSSWFALPWGAPDQVILPGFHTSAENSLKHSAAGNDLFYSLCGLMSTGARTVLISRWRPGGQTSFDLVREFVQELPHTTAADAWQRSVLLSSEQPVNPTQEPRINKAGMSNPPKADHPFFWAGFLLADTGAKPQSEAAEPAAAIVQPAAPAKANAVPAAPK